MTHSRQQSKDNPLDRNVHVAAVNFILTVETMGLLASPVDTLSLTIEPIIEAAKKVAEFGIGRRQVINPDRWREYDSDDLVVKLNELTAVLEDTPVPEREISHLCTLLGDALVAQMAHVSEQSLRRYAQGERETKGPIAERIHWLCLVTGDLLGSYNETGTRNWFYRPRASFGNNSPLGLLAEKEWSSHDAIPMQIRAFVRALSAGMGT
ncbi:MAG: hypothetical protein SFV17_18340 [Candidatus Obscuribacter sp.]|nr:hypothetical protein [Candidatus Obscuribacter sp.]